MGTRLRANPQAHSTIQALVLSGAITGYLAEVWTKRHAPRANLEATATDDAAEASAQIAAAPLPSSASNSSDEGNPIGGSTSGSVARSGAVVLEAPQRRGSWWHSSDHGGGIVTHAIEECEHQHPTVRTTSVSAELPGPHTLLDPQTLPDPLREVPSPARAAALRAQVKALRAQRAQNGSAHSGLFPEMRV